ncbi:MAG: ATP-binding protein [Candidatus Hydrothermarchaeota archaeon]
MKDTLVLYGIDEDENVAIAYCITKGSKKDDSLKALTAFLDSKNMSFNDFTIIEQKVEDIKKGSSTIEEIKVDFRKKLLYMGFQSRSVGNLEADKDTTISIVIAARKDLLVEETKGEESDYEVIEESKSPISREELLKKYRITEPGETFVESLLEDYREPIVTIEMLNKKLLEIIKRIEQPKTVSETKLPKEFIEALILKIINQRGPILVKDIIATTGLHVNIVEEIIRDLEERVMVEYIGTGAMMFSDLRYIPTEKGRERAKMLETLDPFVGVAPVPYKDYYRITEELSQKRFPIKISKSVFEKAFEEVIGLDYAKKIILESLSTGEGMFICGPPGTGKTFISSKISKVLPPMLIPKNILVGERVIKIFDSDFHVPCPREEQPEDPRWVKIYAPFVFTGAELSVSRLEGRFNENEGVYESPPQVKAHGGVLLIDDLGRQMDSHDAILNRLIVPMENRRDIIYVGGTPVVLFTTFIPIFSTNLNIAIFDEAHLRRAPCYIYLSYPPVEHVIKVFKNNLVRLGEKLEENCEEVLEKLYQDPRVKPSFAHARDLAQISQGIRISEGKDVITKDILLKAIERHIVITLGKIGADPRRLGYQTEKRIISYDVKLKFIGEMHPHAVSEEISKGLMRYIGIDGVSAIKDGIIVDAQDTLTPTDIVNLIRNVSNGHVEVENISIITEFTKPMVDEKKLHEKIKSFRI